MHSSINKCLAYVSSNLLNRDKKADERWATLLKKQDEEMQLEKERVAVKKRKEDSMLLTMSTEGMDPLVLVAHNFYKDMILNEISAKMAAVASSSTPTPTAHTVVASAGVSATASTSTPTSASMSTPATASASPTEHDEVVVFDGLATTQDAPSASPNPLLIFMFSLHPDL
jgi:hypothetical protein